MLNNYLEIYLFLLNRFRCFPCMFVQHIHVVLQKPEEGLESPGTGVTDGCEAPCGGLELHMGHLEEHLAVLTSDPSL